jgi:hypothetical protein
MKCLWWLKVTKYSWEITCVNSVNGAMSLVFLLCQHNMTAGKSNLMHVNAQSKLMLHKHHRRVRGWIKYKPELLFNQFWVEWSETCLCDVTCRDFRSRGGNWIASHGCFLSQEHHVRARGTPINCATHYRQVFGAGGGKSGWNFAKINGTVWG